MRPPRLLLLVFCFLFFPIFLTFFSALTSSPRVAAPTTFAGRASGLHALFSFNIPSSLFPPSAIISLTDDNSTFFLARPAAFGPLLPDKGLSGQLWVGSGFGERTAVGAEGELGCSDIPGWSEGDASHRQDKTSPTDSIRGKSVSGAVSDPASLQGIHRRDSQPDADLQQRAAGDSAPLPTNDGTDDHLHHPLHESQAVDSNDSEKHGDNLPTRQTAHADIQSLQESAEIDGKVVLLSRGGCGFLEKVKWVQRRGGVALIVGDNTRGGTLVTMYARGDTSNVTIPALFTSYTTAHLLSSLVPSQPEDLNENDPSGLSLSKLSSSRKPENRVEATTSKTTTTSAVSSPLSTRIPQGGQAQNPEGKNGGLIHSVLSAFGLGRHGGYGWHPQDSRRPPTSGNINWIPLDLWDDQDASKGAAGKDKSRTKVDSTVDDRRKPDSDSLNSDGDGFVIGVQDWRDPDLMAPRSSIPPSPTGAAEQEGTKLQHGQKTSRSTPVPLKGGSITPGSGEYRTVEKASLKRVAKAEISSRDVPAQGGQGHSAPSNGWLARHFRWAEDDDQTKPGAAIGSRQDQREKRQPRNPSPLGSLDTKSSEHEGLWVTLTPTSMSTSPFFDTLLVLVVSPLLTLTVVYALLLLRSRIRRRRWRAPKSLVERLPVRTYHTISTSSSSSSSSPRSASPGPVSPTSPLLGTRSRAGRARSRQRSHEMTGSVAESTRPAKLESFRKEKSDSSTLWRRKYTGRQVECVVCLEEYIDGQSRVMSLPCGHEFHAECITPWLTTRRRTCPICKGDVVRSMAQHRLSEARDTAERTTAGDDSTHGASSAPVPISGVSEEETSDLEERAGSDIGLLEEHASSAPQPGWRNLAAMSFSALSGDTIWHQGGSRTDSYR